MPRDGSGIYGQPFPDVVTDTTIESPVYNGFTRDVELDLNTPRPIIAGGTGASSAMGARDNLDAEVATAIVTNYDTQVWEAGSFRSDVGATSAPVPGVGLSATHAFAGTCLIYNSNDIVLEAYDVSDGLTPPTCWVRHKSTTWGPWVSSTANNDSRYVNVTGDVMTGALTVSTPAATDHSRLIVNATGASAVGMLEGKRSGSTRWQLRMPDSTVESGGHTGSNFTLYSFKDDGVTLQSTALTINRQSSSATFGGSIYVSAIGDHTRLALDTTAAGVANIIEGKRGGLLRWQLRLGDGAAEGGSHTGNDFAVYSYTDSGVFRDAPLTIRRSTGAAIFSSGAQIAGGLDVSSGALTVTNSILAAQITCAGPSAPIMYINNTSGSDDARLRYTNAGSTRHQVMSQGGSYYIYNGASSAGVYLNTQAATSWSAVSDARLKTDVEDLAVLDMLSSFRAVRYTYTPTGKRELGIIAQEQVEQFPELIHVGSDGALAAGKTEEENLKMAQETWSAIYDRLGAVALQGVKELLERVKALEAEVAALRAG